MSSQPITLRQALGASPSTATIHDSTLIIIDAQNEYANGLLATKNVTQTRAAIAALLNKYRQNQSANGANIIHVLHEVPEGAPVFTPGTPLAAEFDELAPKAGEKVIHKPLPSSFAQTDLNEYLKGLGAVGRKIVLVGYMAHVCVSTTARAGNELGYDVIVARDAVGDRDIPGVGGKKVEGERLVEITLSELADAFATVVNSEEIKT